MCHTNYCNFAEPKGVLRYNGDFVISGFVIPGFHCTHSLRERKREVRTHFLTGPYENEKKRQYSSRVLDIEHGTLMPLVFIVFATTGGMGRECLRYCSRLAELIPLKKGEQYAKTISWIRAKTSFCSTEICPHLLERIKKNKKSPL